MTRLELKNFLMSLSNEDESKDDIYGSKREIAKSVIDDLIEYHDMGEITDEEVDLW